MLTRVLSAVVTCILLFILNAPPAAAQALSDAPADSGMQICKDAAPAVVSLYSVGRGSQSVTSRGTGFLISADGILITARHVSEGNEELFAFTENGQKYRVTGFYGEDRDYDVAVLKIQGEHFPHLALSEAPKPQADQWVMVVSREGDGSLLSTNGRVSQVSGFPTVWEVIGITIPVHPGQSGSPLLDGQGKVVGVVSAAGSSSEQCGAAMPIAIVRRILERTGTNGPVSFTKRPRKAGSEPLVMDPDFRAVFSSGVMNNLTESERRMKAVARKFPESPVPLAMLGTFYTQHQSWKPAEAVFAKAIKLNPDFAYAWLMRGTVAFCRGRFVDAEKALRKSIELQLENKVLISGAWEMLAGVSAERGNTNSIREALDNLELLDAKKANETYNNIRRLYPKLDLPIDRNPH